MTVKLIESQTPDEGGSSWVTRVRIASVPRSDALDNDRRKHGAQAKKIVAIRLRPAGRSASAGGARAR